MPIIMPKIGRMTAKIITNIKRLECSNKLISKNKDKKDIIPNTRGFHKFLTPLIV